MCKRTLVLVEDARLATTNFSLDVVDRVEGLGPRQYVNSELQLRRDLASRLGPDRIDSTQEENGMKWLDVVVAGSTALSAAFVGWQALMLREALSDPFEANLQNRQIDACTKLAKEWRSYDGQVVAAVYQLDPMLPRETSDGEPPDREFMGQPVVDAEFYGISAFIRQAQEGLQNSLLEISLLSQGESRKAVDRALGIMYLGNVRLTHAFYPSTEAEASSWEGNSPGGPAAKQRAELNAEITLIIDRCGEAMRGELQGML